jgi:hypothetical protein
VAVAVPRDWWLENWEKRAIIDYHDRHPLEGYRRITFMMLDGDVVAVGPASVYGVLKQAGRLDHRQSSPMSSWANSRNRPTELIVRVAFQSCPLPAKKS